MHANTDEDGFVKKMTYTPGNLHDSNAYDKLLGMLRLKSMKRLNIKSLAI
jgi:IS5 family transposase